MTAPLRLILHVLALLMGLVANASGASAGQAQNAYCYSHWTFSGGASAFWKVDQELRVTRRATSTYWALDWTWFGASTGGYAGLQTNGSRFDGSTGDTAIFSAWGATAASGPHCGAFSGEGSGLSCRLAYPVSAGIYYRLRIWRLAADSRGQWWGAWVLNTDTGKETMLGELRLPAADRLASNVKNFVEYFGSAVACTAIPKSQVTWTQPAANSDGKGGYASYSRYVAQAGDRGTCTGGSATPVDLGWTKGVSVTLGG